MVRVRATFGPLAELTAGIGTAAVAWADASQVLAGRLSLGSLVVFLSYLASLYTPIQGLSRAAGQPAAGHGRRRTRHGHPRRAGQG